MNDIILSVMAFGALAGGLDRLLGNRFGLGTRFEEAFQLLGPIGLSMAGIICLAPLLSRLLSSIVVPLFCVLDLDPGIFGGILAIDMGGYQLAMELALNSQIGRFAGIIVSAIFGCTLVFTIPVGLGTMQEQDRPCFTRGILLGLASMPVGILAGGLVCGLSPLSLLKNTLPILLVCLLLFVGIRRSPGKMAHAFQVLAAFIRQLSTLGLMLGAIQYMTGLPYLQGLAPLSAAMETVCSIAIVMLGSMPLAELLQRMLEIPFAWVGKHTCLNAASTTGLLIGAVSVVPALAMIPRMDDRGKVVNGAFLVCAASTFAAHLGFTVTMEPELVPALLLSKLLGGFLGVVTALIATRNMAPAQLTADVLPLSATKTDCNRERTVL